MRYWLNEIWAGFAYGVWMRVAGCVRADCRIVPTDDGWTGVATRLTRDIWPAFTNLSSLDSIVDHINIGMNECYWQQQWTRDVMTYRHCPLQLEGIKLQFSPRKLLWTISHDTWSPVMYDSTTPTMARFILLSNHWVPCRYLRQHSYDLLQH